MRVETNKIQLNILFFFFFLPFMLGLTSAFYARKSFISFLAFLNGNAKICLYKYLHFFLFFL